VIDRLWQNAASLLAGIEMLGGVDPKMDYRDVVAKGRPGKG
jgi:hypothetical protein